jgi:hypothetical protein
MNFIKNLLAVYKIHLWAVAICYVIGFFYLKPESPLKKPNEALYSNYYEKYVDDDIFLSPKDHPSGDFDTEEELQAAEEHHRKVIDAGVYQRYYDTKDGMVYDTLKEHEVYLWRIGYGWLGLLLAFSIFRKTIIDKLIQLWPSIVDDGSGLFFIGVSCIWLFSAYPLKWLGSGNQYNSATVFISICVFIFLEFRRRINLHEQHKEDVKNRSQTTNKISSEIDSFLQRNGFVRDPYVEMCDICKGVYSMVDSCSGLGRPSVFIKRKLDEGGQYSDYTGNNTENDKRLIIKAAIDVEMKRRIHVDSHGSTLDELGVDYDEVSPFKYDLYFDSNEIKDDFVNLVILIIESSEKPIDLTRGFKLPFEGDNAHYTYDYRAYEGAY